MTDTWWLIALLAAATFAIRLAGVAIGQRLPREGAWARALTALPGCLIVSLITVLLLDGGAREWLAALVAGAAALWTRNLPITMGAGIFAIWLLRQLP